MVELTKIALPEFPPEQDKVVHERVSIGSEFGKIRKLKIVLAKEPIPDSLRGIGIQRGRMTVCRHPLPPSTPEDIRERMYGYCMMDDRLDEEMWSIELANHEGFEARRKVWVDLRRKIDGIAEEFVRRHSKGKKLAPPPMNLDEIIKTVNKLVEEHLGGLGPGKRRTKNGKVKPLPPVYISPWGYLGSSRRFDTGDIMEIKGAVGNTTGNLVKVNFEAWIGGSSGATKFWSHGFKKLRVNSKSKTQLSFPRVDFSNLSLSKGKYSLKAEIRDNRKNLLHKRTAIFYFEQDPPPMGGWLKHIHFDSLGGPAANLRNVPINEKGVLLINLAYPEFHMIWSSSTLNKRQKIEELKRIVINIALHEAVREVSINWWKNPSIEYDISEIKKAKDIFDEMWADYLRGSAI